jgi:hypothetical protein
MEAIQEKFEKDPGHGHGFEPEILAFCCEH